MQEWYLQPCIHQAQDAEAAFPECKALHREGSECSMAKFQLALLDCI